MLLQATHSSKQIPNHPPPKSTGLGLGSRIQWDFLPKDIPSPTVTASLPYPCGFGWGFFFLAHLFQRTKIKAKEEVLGMVGGELGDFSRGMSCPFAMNFAPWALLTKLTSGTQAAPRQGQPGQGGNTSSDWFKYFIVLLNMLILAESDLFQPVYSICPNLRQVRK